MSSGTYEALVRERSDADRLAEAVGIPSDIRYCACGCGEPLKATQKSQWVRGHRMAKIAEKNQRDPDPAPLKEEASKDLSKEVTQDIEDQLEFWLSIIGFAWESRDPFCGKEFSDRTDRLAQKLVPIISRNPKMVKFFTDGGNFKLWADLGVVLGPIVKSVAQHHIFHTIGQDYPEDNEMPHGIDVARYPV